MGEVKMTKSSPNVEKKTKCILEKEGKCNSVMAKGLECDGIDISADCPYKFEEKEE